MSAPLFTWLQAAPFYERLHADAVAEVPPAAPGARWIDVGCGPGLVARLAADRGHDALGLDRSVAQGAAASSGTPASEETGEAGRPRSS